MKVQLFTQTMSHGESTRTAGNYKPILTFRKDRVQSNAQGASYGGNDYIMTSAHSFDVGQIVKYGGQFYRVRSIINALAYVYQYKLEVMP